ncbi:MAG: lamin tail domain-containing protein [Anaerolineae bacterium]|nr:lamin tail domain-containing protein [Anaerolineae bacterium]MDW8103028.1 lamin tail domain-containing protein [Anaerolineae bacterium]
MSHRKILLLALIPAVASFLILALNAALAQGEGNPADIVISEVMFNAITETNPLNCGEWLEIYNKGAVTINLVNWIITDNNRSNLITYTMCPNNSCEIPPGGCWLIAYSQTYLQAEFNYYTSPLSPTVDPSRTIFLGGRIGNGLANETDWVILRTPDNRNVDCISWGSPPPTICAGLSYVPGGSGLDTNLTSEAEGQSIANIQGQWYYHKLNASPYNCINVAQGGNPTATFVTSFFALSEPFWFGPLMAGMFIAFLILWRAVKQRPKGG